MNNGINIGRLHASVIASVVANGVAYIRCMVIYTITGIVVDSVSNIR